MEAGASSFKIEGRLKDIYYVKNVVAAYSQRLNEIIDRQPDQYRRSSLGRCTYTFTPNLNKTFNRGFTHYFLHGRQPDIASFDTPKAIGEYVGRVKEIRGGSFNVAGTASFANGDGLCFFFSDDHGAARKTLQLEGFRVNKVVNNRLFPQKMPTHLRPGMALYRNNDQEFERLLSKPSAERKLEISMVMEAVDDGFTLIMTDRTGRVMGETNVVFAHQEAQKPQLENIRAQLTKLGGTPYVCNDVVIRGHADRYFIPSSVLSDMRRKVVVAASGGQESHVCGNLDAHSACHEVSSCLSKGEGSVAASPQVPMPKEYREHPYLYNIANSDARRFYEQQGLRDIAPAFEQGSQAYNASHAAPLLMQCRHCLRYSLGYCVKNGGRKPQWREPLSLVLPDGKRFRLQFDCQQCQMNVYAE